MKINPIGMNVVPKVKTSGNIVENKVENPISSNSLVLPNDYTKLAFMANKMDHAGLKQIKDMKENFTPEAEDIYSATQDFAKSIGAKEMETWHFYYNSLLFLKDYIQELDEGRGTHGEETRLKMPFELENMVAVNCTALSNEKARAKIAEVLDKHIEIVQNDFIAEELSKPQSKIKMPSLSKPQLSMDCANDLVETYDLLAKEMESDKYFEAYCL